MDSRGQDLHSSKDTIPTEMQYFLQAMLIAFANCNLVCQLSMKQITK